MENLIPQSKIWSFQAANFLGESSATRYISPEFSIHSEELAREGTYLIIAAPGAVGKSALGQHLKSAKNAMLWNLAKLRLGSNTFIGSVLEAVGAAQLSEFLASIATGDTVLVFDAIDEAQMHSGWSGVQDFIQEVIKYTPNARPASVVFLARRDTAEMLDLALSDLVPEGQSYATAGIGFFSRSSAVEFVLSYVESVKGRPFLDRHKSVLEEKASEALSLAVSPSDSEVGLHGWGSKEQERFFGYAPVLQTIGKLLAEAENAYNLSFHESRTGYVAIVSEILERILDREMEKVASAIAQRFPSEKEKLATLYSREDQQARILGLLTSDEGAAYALPSVVNQKIAADVVDVLRTFLPQHPFLDGAQFAGPAFRDYVLAYALTNSERRFSAEFWIDSAQPLYTPILASLYHIAGGGNAEANDAELLYESANAGALNGQSGLLLFQSEESKDGLTLEISTDDSDPLGEHLAFEVGAPEEVRFVRRLNNAQIVVDSRLVLGRSDQGFDISECEIQAGSIRVEANRISVRSETGGATHIEAADPTVAPPTLKVDVQHPNLLTVSWPGSKNYPWTQFSTESRVQDAVVDARTTLHVIARILGWFRKDRRKEYGRYRDLVIKHVVGQSPAARYALGFLYHIGALSESGNLLFVDVNVLDSHEVSWQKIQSGTVSDRAVEAVAAYLRDTPQPPQF